MAKVSVRFVGGGLKPTDRLAASLVKSDTFAAQRDAIVGTLSGKISEAAFAGLNMHIVLDEEKDGKKSKKPGRVLEWSETVEALNGSHWIWLMKKPAASGGVAPPPPRPAAKKTAAPTGDTSVPPPPPPPRPASKAQPTAAASHPPTPTSGDESSAGGVPPPPPPRPQPKSVQSTPNAAAAIPPPPPPRPVSPAPRASDPDHGGGEAVGALTLPPPPPQPRAKSPQRAPAAESSGSLTLAVPPPPPMPGKKGKSASRAPSRNVSPVRGGETVGGLGGMTFMPASKALDLQKKQEEEETAIAALKKQEEAEEAARQPKVAPTTPKQHARPVSRQPSPTPQRAPGLTARPSASRQPSPARSPAPTLTVPAAAPAGVASPAPREPTSQRHQQQQQHSNLDSGNDVGAAAAAVPEDRLLQVQRQLMDEERRRLEDMERRIAESVERETSRARATLEATYEEQRARSLQQQTQVAEERAELMAKLAAREEQLFESQSKLINDFQRRTAGGVGPDGAPANPAVAELHRSNEEMREMLARRRKEIEADRGKTSEDVAQVVKMQAQLMATLTELQRTAASSSSSAAADSKLTPTQLSAVVGSDGGDPAVAIANYDALTRFMDGLGLGKYTAVLLKHDVDMAALNEMSDGELQAAGITTIGARKLIRMELAKLSEEEDDARRGARPSRDAKMMAATGGAVTNLSATQLRRHERVLKRFFDLVKEPQLAARAEAIARQFSGQLDALYGGLAHRYDICVSPSRAALGAFFRRERLDFLLPALDVICFSYESREAEFAEVVLLEALGVSQQPLTWLEFTAADDECPPPMSPTRRSNRSRRTSASPSGQVTPGYNQDGAATPQHGAGADGSRTPQFQQQRNYYYCALVHLSQWTVPRVAHKTDISIVAEAEYHSIPDRGGRLLEPNPRAEDMLMVQSANHRYLAAAVALLMRHDPTRLTQFNALRKQYSTPRDAEYARGGGGGDDASGGGGHPLNAKGLFKDLCRWYHAGSAGTSGRGGGSADQA